MSETQQINPFHSELPNSLDKSVRNHMLHDSCYELDKSRIGGKLFPQFTSLLRDCHELQSRPLKIPKEVAMLSSGLISNERAWSAPMQGKRCIEEKLGCGIDTRGMSHSFC